MTSLTWEKGGRKAQKGLQASDLSYLKLSVCHSAPTPLTVMTYLNPLARPHDSSLTHLDCHLK